MNLTSAQVHHKENVQKLEASEASLRQSLARATALEQEIASKDDHIKRTEQKFQAIKKNVHNTHTEVCYFAEHRNIFIS